MPAADQTRFGSPALPAESAAGVLRARAKARGVVLRAAGPADLAASAIGADAWVALTGAPTLDRPSDWGRAATSVLAAVLVRAAGHAGEVLEAPLDACPMSDDLLRLAEEHRAWAAELFPGAPREVLRRAASDLLAAGSSTRFAEYAAMLSIVADL